MKVRILMATLAVTLMLGAQSYANPCDCAGVDPCAACSGYAAKGNLFSGLKRLVNGVRIANNCDPCEPVVACNPCDVVSCDPCDAVCDQPRIGFGGRLLNLFAGPSMCSPCNGAGNCFDVNCDPCGYAQNCDPCGDVDGCCAPRFSLRGFNPFRGFGLNRGCFSDCDPCTGAGNCYDSNCGPCDVVGNCFDRHCDPCNGVMDCGPCDVLCGDDYCGPRGHLFDLPRFSLSRLFDGFRIARCNVSDCGPCDDVRPCNGVCCR